MTVQFTGRKGVPTTGVSAVQVNIVTISPTATGSMFAWPAGEAAPSAPNFYFYANSGLTSSSSTVRVNSAGAISFKNGSAGTVRILADVTGYYTDASSQASGNRFVPLRQARVIDTRSRIGVTTNTPVPANSAITVTIASKGGLPAAANITAAVVNVTAWTPTGGGGWTLYPGGSARPSAYHGNFGAAKPYTNSAVVQLSSTGSLTLFNVSSGTTHYTVDVVGYFTAATNPAAISLRSVPVAQQRVLDSGSAALVPVNGVQTLQLFGRAGLPASGVTFAALRVTAYGSTTSGEVVTYPGNETRPTGVTDVAPPSANTLSFNLVWARVSPTGTVSIVNGTNAGVRLYVDIQAYAVAPSKPQPPLHVTGGARDRAVEVRWDPPADSGDLPIAGYDILTSPGGQTASTSTGTSVVVQGLTNGTAYTFQVRAKTAAGASDYSAASQAIKPAAPAPPGAPFITNTLGRDSEAVVTWSAPEGAVDQVASYKVTTVPATTPVTVAGDQHSATLPSLTNGQLYKVVVTATNANGSTASMAVPVIPKVAEVPLKPMDLALFQLDGRLDIQWVQPADGGADILDYEVTANPGDHRIVIPAGTTVTGFTGLDNGTMYTVKVRARNKTGTGDWSVATGTPSATRPPNAPTDLQASVAENGTITVAWEPPIDTGSAPITGYRVTVSPGGRVVDTTSLSAAVDGLDQQTQYTFVVSALNMHGAGLPTAASRPIKPTIAVAQDPIVLTADSMSRIANVGTTSISVTNPNAQLNAIQAGAIVVATSSPATPEGLLRKVLRVDTGTVLVFQTEDASLPDVVSDGALSRDIKIKDSDGLRFQQETPGATLRHPTVKGKTLRQGAPRARAGTSATVDPPTFGLHDGKFTFEFSADIDHGVHVEIAGSLDPSFEVNGGPGSPQSEYTIKADTNIEYRVDQSFWRGEKERRIPIGHLRGACVAVYLGRLPVEMCPGVDVYVVLTVEGRAGIRLVGHSSGQFGDRIRRNGNTLSDEPFGDQSLVSEPHLDAFGNIDETLALEPDIMLLFYGTAGPYITAKPYARAEADTDKNPFIAGFLGVQLTGGLTADLATKNVLHQQFEGFRWEQQVFDSGGPIRNVLIDPPSAELAVGETIDFNSRIFGYPDEPATWSVVKGPGTVTQDGVYDAVADGVVKVQALVPPNGDHGELTAEAGIYVGPHVPTPPRDVTATPGNLAALVTWREPSQPGGNPIDHYVLTTEPDTGSHTVPGSNLSTVIGGLRAGVSYTVSVFAVTAAGQSGPGTSQPVVAGSPLIDNPGANDLMRGMDGKTSTVGVELSDDGRYAFFPLSLTPDEVGPPGIPRDGNFYLVRRDLANGEVELASRAADARSPQMISAAVDPLSGGFGRPKPKLASAANGRYIAYIVDGDGPARKVMVYDFDEHAVWTADPGISAPVERIALSDSGSILALNTLVEDPGYPQGDVRKIFRAVKGSAVQRIDMCTSSLVCDSANMTGMPGDGNTIVYTMTVNDNRSPYFNGANEYVFYNASTGQVSMPYYKMGGLSFGPMQLSRDGRYFISNALLMKGFDPDSSAVVVKRLGTGVVTESDIVQGGYYWDIPGVPLAVSNDANILAWEPGASDVVPARPGHFVVQDRADGTRVSVQDPAPFPPFTIWSMTMTPDGSMVAWLPGTSTTDPDPAHPLAQRIG
ncbi:fibronectin type III domain-containing protein [Kribbella sp. NPDC050459]|uniref:fibronectin type III domain-containing protein n=1 Tax=Kribbella sp. NPDC050459 TaxID=3155785 RepID=UPI0033F2E257